MYLCKTSTPGVAELSGIGGQSQAIYDKTMTLAALKRYSIVVASVIDAQKNEAKLLLKNGFMQAGNPKRNPNTGNLVFLFIKFIRNGS